jgi:hypothetical protein
VITITDFSAKFDQINLLHFPNLHSIDDLVYRTNPLIIFLSSEQQLILPGVEMTDLTEENFIFHSDSDRQKYKSQFHLDRSAVITLGILIGCVGVFGCMVFMNPSVKDEEISMDSNENKPENSLSVKEELSSSLDDDSLLESSSDSELEEDDDDDDEDSLRESEMGTLNDEEDTLRDHERELFASLKSMFSSDQDEDDDNFGDIEEQPSDIAETEMENDLHFIRELLKGNVNRTEEVGYEKQENDHSDLEGNYFQYTKTRKDPFHNSEK